MQAQSSEGVVGELVVPHVGERGVDVAHNAHHIGDGVFAARKADLGAVPAQVAAVLSVRVMHASHQAEDPVRKQRADVLPKAR
eukprot:scaffold14445_cov127-Isochrysis_galbana.AAC.6